MTHDLQPPSEPVPDLTTRPPALSGPKRQHFLPRFYLERFIGDDGCIAVFDRNLNQLRRQQPQNTGVEGHLYTLRDDQGRQRFELEQELGRIEGQASRILPAIVSERTIGDDDRALLSYFFALLSVRTPEFISSIKHFNAEIMKKFARIAFSDVDRVKDILRTKPEHTGIGDSSLEEQAIKMVEFAQGDGYEIITDHVWAVKMAIPLADRIAPIMNGRKWSIIEAPDGKSFVTSDAPVYLTTLLPRNDRFFGIGFGNPDALTLIPLDTKHILAMHGETGGIDYRTTDAERVRSINLGMAAGCQRFLIGRDDNLVSSIAKASGIAHTQRRPKLAID